MWKCEKCGKKFKKDVMAVDVRFGYIDEDEVKNTDSQYDAFYTDSAWGPLCDECAINYIKNGE